MHKAMFILTLAATLCVAAIPTGAVSAAKFIPTLMGVGGEQVIQANGTPVKCLKAEGTSKLVEAEQIKSTAEFKECEIEGIGKATVECTEFNFHSTGTVSTFEGMGRDTEGSVTTGTCTAKVAAGICVITLPSQEATKGVVYLNLAHAGEKPEMDVDITASVSGLKYTSKGACLGLEKEGKNAEYKGSLLISAVNGQDILLE